MELQSEIINSNIVLLTGAGASAPLGMPTMSKAYNKLQHSAANSTDLLEKYPPCYKNVMNIQKMIRIFKTN